MTELSPADPWLQLAAELDAWEQQGRAPTLWWRDDDAQTDSEALEQLCALSRRFEIPLALAVIPQGSEHSLCQQFDRTDGLYALQHGFSHSNHAAAGQRKCELGAERPLQQVLIELKQGQQQLRSLLGESFLPVLVPPWNRLADSLIPELVRLGYQGLSTLGPRSQPLEHGLWLNHVQIDLINWRDGRRFAGDSSVLGQLVEHLRQRRQGLVDPDEATGLMTHHLAHDQGCWAFCQRLFEFLQSRPVRWLTAEQCFTRSV